MQEGPGNSERESAAQPRSPVIRATDILIAARREAERILREAEQRANEVLQSAPEPAHQAAPSPTPPFSPPSAEPAQISREREEILGRIDDMGRAIASAIREELAQLRDVLITVQRGEQTAAASPPVAPRAATREALFRPEEDKQLHLSVTNIPGFDHLSTIHTALSALPELDDVTIARYEDGEADLLIDFHDPLRATDIVEALAQGGLSATVERSQPDTLELRLALQA